MKAFEKNSFAVTVSLLLAICAQVSLALENGIGDPTVPASSRVSGLRKSPNPINTRGNLVITGNVAGGKAFRGPVPYRSVSEFGAPLGSDRLNSFLRYSAPPRRMRGSRTNQLTPQVYYNPSRTVSSMYRSGSPSGLAVPSNLPTNKISSGRIKQNQNPLLKSLNNEPALSEVDDYSIARPLSFTTTDLERIVSYNAEKSSDKNELTKALSRAVTNKISKPSKTNSEIDIQYKNQNTLSSTEVAKRAERLIADAQQLEIPKIEKQDKPKSFGYSSVYEQMLAEVAEAEKTEAEIKIETDKKNENSADTQEPLQNETGSLESTISNITPETTEATVGIHKSFAAGSDDKFNYYMRTAEEFLNSGNYYRASDAYTLASIYKPDDPLAYAGRAHALFASGEYMSSAYFLIRAINIFPEYAKFKIDINAMIPDKDRLESRIADVKEWIKKTESGELSFLLAYIYYQFQMDEFAVAAIEFASKKLPDNTAVKTLERAIKIEAAQR